MTSSSGFAFRNHSGSLTGISFAFIVFIVVSLLSTVPDTRAKYSNSVLRVRHYEPTSTSSVFIKPALTWSGVSDGVF